MDEKKFSFNELRNSEYELGKYISEQMKLGKKQTTLVDELNKEFVKVQRKKITTSYASRLKNIYDLYVGRFGIERELLEGVSFLNLDELKPFSTNSRVATKYVTQLRVGDSLLSILEEIDDSKAEQRAKQIKAKQAERVT